MASKRKLASPGMGGFLFPGYGVVLDTNTLSYGSAEGTQIGTFTPNPADAVLSLRDDDGGKFKLDGNVLQAGAVATSAEADGAFQNITVRVTQGFQFWDFVVTVALSAGGGGALGPETDVSGYSIRYQFFYTPDAVTPDLVGTMAFANAPQNWSPYNIAIVDGGTGYALGETVTINDQTGSGGLSICFVRGVDGNGAITALQYYEDGPNNTVEPPTTINVTYYPTTHSGTGAVVSAKWSKTNLAALIQDTNILSQNSPITDNVATTYSPQFGPASDDADGAWGADVSNGLMHHGDGKWLVDLLDGSGNPVPNFFTIISTPGDPSDDFVASITDITLLGLNAP